MISAIPDLSRRSMLGAVSALSVGGVLLPIVGGSAASAASNMAPSVSSVVADDTIETTAVKVTDALEGAYGRHEGLRRNHTKGVGVLGHFIGHRDAAEFSRSSLFSGRKIEVIGRFSLAGGNPAASDLENTPRGLALEFRLPDGELHHMTMLHTPMFFAAAPKTFLDKFIALKIEDNTGKADPALFKSYLATHPDNDAQVKFLAATTPPTSYARCPFFGIHTFKFTDKQERTTLIRFRFVPHDGVANLSHDEVESYPKDFLAAALKTRISQGPVAWDMMVTIGEPGDPEVDPTVLWPSERREIKAGTLVLDRVIPDAQAGSYKINFDPLMLSDGVAATKDPILLFRSTSYALSHERRLREI